MVDGFSSADPSLARGPQVVAAPRTISGGGGRSTLARPTPAAGELTGTAKEREAQIKAFRGGGRSALIAEKEKQAKQRAVEQAKTKAAEIAKAAELAKRTQTALRQRSAQDQINQLRNQRNQRIKDLIEENRKIGILTTESSARRVIEARERAEIKDIQQESRAKMGATGEVQPVGTSVFQTFTTIKTGRREPTSQERKTLSQLNEEVAKKITIPVSEFIKEKTGIDLRDPSSSEARLRKKIEELQKRPDIIGKIARTIEPSQEFLKGMEQKTPVAEFERGLIEGSIGGVIEEPVTVGVSAGIGLGFGRLAPSVLGQVAKLPGGKTVGNLLTTGAATVFFGQVGYEAVTTPTAEGKGRVIGKAATTELFPFMLGAKVGNVERFRAQIKKDLEVELNKLSPERRAAFDSYMRQTQEFRKFEPKAENIKLDNIEGIKDPKAQQIVRDFLKSNKDILVVGGSVAQTGQIKVKRKLGDMDLYVEGGLDPGAASQNLANRLRAGGVERVSSPSPGTITIEGVKAIEFHDIGRLHANIRQVTPNWVSPRRYIMKTPEGIKIQRIGVQAQRKLVAAFADPKRFATGKYQKDLKDFKKIAESLYQGSAKKVLAEQPGATRLKEIKSIKVVAGRTGRPVDSFEASQPSQIGISQPKITSPNIFLAPSQKRVSEPSQPKVIPSQSFIPPSQPPIKTKEPPLIKTPITPKKSPPSQPPVFIEETLTPTPSVSKPKQPRTRKARESLGARKGLLFRLEEKITKAKPGWVAEVLENKKWKKVNPKKPVSKKRAEKLGKLTADRTIAASSRVTKAKKSAMDLFRGLAVDDKKFRDFKIKAGKKIPQKNLWIEKRKHRLDTKSETQTLQQFKRSAEFKGLAGKPKKKKKAAKRKSTNLFFR